MSGPHARRIGGIIGFGVASMLLGSVMLTPALAHREKGEAHKHLAKVMAAKGFLKTAEANNLFLGKTATATNSSLLQGASLNSIAAGNDAYIADCDPDSAVYVQCGGAGGGATITLTREAKVLVLYGWAWSNSAAEGTLSDGKCQTTRNGQSTSGDIQLGLVQDYTNGAYAEAATPIVDVQGPLAPGTYTFGLKCNSFIGDMYYRDIRIAVLVMGTA